MMRLANALAIGCVLGVVPATLRGTTNEFPEFELATARDYLQTICQLVRAQAGMSAESLYIQARLQNQMGRKDDAEALARQALELDPSRADIYVFVAEIYIRKDRMEEASACLKQAAAANPREKGAYRQLGMVLDRLGQHDQALEALRSAIREYPEDDVALLLLGRALLEQGKPADALPLLERACRLQPDTGNAFYALFQAQSRLGNQDAAKKALARFQQLKVKEKGMLDANEALYNNEQETRSYSAGFHVEVATLLMQEKKEQLGEQHLLRATRIAPYEPKAFELLGDYYVARNRLPDAKPIYAALTLLRPHNTLYALNYSTVLANLGEFGAAEAELKRVAAIQPDAPEVLRSLARLYLSQRRQLGEALTLSQRLANLDPSARSYDLLGWACYANGRTNDALAAAAQAVQRDPTNTAYAERLRRLQSVAGVKN